MTERDDAAPGAGAPGTAATGSAAAPAPDDSALEELRQVIAAVDGLPVADRVAVFERVNQGVAHELARLDEV